MEYLVFDGEATIVSQHLLVMLPKILLKHKLK